MRKVPNKVYLQQRKEYCPGVFDVSLRQKDNNNCCSKARSHGDCFVHSEPATTEVTHLGKPRWLYLFSLLKVHLSELSCWYGYSTRDTISTSKIRSDLGGIT